MAVGKLEYKTCTKCGKTLPKTEQFFYKDKKIKDGLYGSCKECVKSRSRHNYRVKNKREGADKKTCTKCGETLPATTDYFYFNKSRDALHSWCKKCKDDYSKKRMQKWRQKQKNQHAPAKLVKMAIKQKEIDALKEKYPPGMGIEIRTKERKIYGRVTGHYKHFMTVQTRHYITSISYVDILIGTVQVK